ncbi:hypothetical protein SERLADRAFT_403091, partial [Serpula lacrymans var. lacrymans S7.9]
VATHVRELAHSQLKAAIERHSKKLKYRVLSVQVDDHKRQYRQEAASREENDQRKVRLDFICQINKLSRSGTHTCTLSVDSVQEVSGGTYGYS